MSAQKFSIIVSLLLSIHLWSCAASGTNLSISAENISVKRAIDQEILSGVIDSAFSKIDLLTIEKNLSTYKPRPARGLKIATMATQSVMATNQVPISPPSTVVQPSPTTSENTPPQTSVVSTSPVLVQQPIQYKEIEEPVRNTLSAYVEVSSVVPIDPNILKYIEQKSASIVGKLGIRIFEVPVKVSSSNQSITPILETMYPDTDAKVLVSVSYVGIDEKINRVNQKSHADITPYEIIIGKFKATISIIPRQADFKAISADVSSAEEYKVGYGNYIRLNHE